MTNDNIKKLFVYIKRNAECIIKLADKTNKPNEFLIRDLETLVNHIHDDIKLLKNKSL